MVTLWMSVVSFGVCVRGWIVSEINRRLFFSFIGGALAGASACDRKRGAGQSNSSVAIDPKVLRVASVRTAVEGGLLPRLIAQFETSTGMRVELTTGEMVYSRAREGGIDLVISHFGHKEAEQFIIDG